MVESKPYTVQPLDEWKALLIGNSEYKKEKYGFEKLK